MYKYVKRCIGLPGDSVRIENRKVFVNNEEFLLPQGGQFLSKESSPESYFDESTFMNLGNKDNMKEIKIPKEGDTLSIDEEMNWEFVIPLLLFEGNKVELVFNNSKLTFTNEDPYDLFRRTGDRKVFDKYVPQPNSSLINPWTVSYTHLTLPTIREV